MSQSEKSFTVSDRRHFTVDGRPREEGEASATDTPERETATQGPAEAQTETSPPTPERTTAAGPADFGQFLLSLGSQGAMLLSGRGLPEGAAPSEAREGARSIISILEMLRDKTEGRRTPAEDEILQGLLFDLRMAYVEKTRTGGQ
jgi:hypothetical protein